MSFEVQSAALRAARTTLQGLADDTASADSYAATWLELGGGDVGMFQHVDNVARSTLSRLDDVFDRLRNLLDESGIELAAAARRYDLADAESAAASDAGLPLVDGAGQGFSDLPPVDDTVPQDPGDYQPDADQPAPPEWDDDEIPMAPGPLGGVPNDPGAGTVTA